MSRQDAPCLTHTPLNAPAVGKKKTPLTLTDTELLIKVQLKKITTNSGKSVQANFDNSCSWLILSNALLRSRKQAYTVFPSL